MKITKVGHCCLIIEVGNLRILTDPGNYSTGQVDVKNIDVILITHEHADHLHLESLKKVLENNPNAKIITNQGVGALLDDAKIKYQIIGHGQRVIFKNILIEGFGKEHAIIYPTWKMVENTGYFINNEFFYPGDAFYKLARPVDILALPVAGPWLKISEAIDYVLSIRPRISFPVHDGMLQKDKIGAAHRIPEKILKDNDIDFVIINEGETKEFNKKK